MTRGAGDWGPVFAAATAVTSMWLRLLQVYQLVRHSSSVTPGLISESRVNGHRCYASDVSGRSTSTGTVTRTLPANLRYQKARL